MSHPCRRAVLLLVAVTVLSWLPTAAGATAQHAAGLVVDTGDRVVTVYVEFPEGEDTITGEELLVLADVDAEFADYGSMGKAVCSILGVGSPSDDCFREAERNGLYWNYSRARDGAWERSSQGVSQTTVEHGDVDGWAWGSQGSEPPYHSFEEIRAQHAPEPSPTPSPSPSPSQTPTEQPAAADTHEPEALSPTADASADALEPETAAPEAPATVRDPTPSSGPVTPTEPAPASPSPSDSEPVVATGEPAAAERDPLPPVLLAVVLGGLVGAIVWRRVRSGGRGAPDAS